MASAFTSTFYKSIRVRRGSTKAKPWQAVSIDIGDLSITLSFEEAAQLEADLHELNSAHAIAQPDKAEGLA